MSGHGLSPGVSSVLGDPTAPINSTLSALAAERQMLVVATEYAMDGDFMGAWDIVSADIAQTPGQKGLSPDRLGWRTATVIGFLGNRGNQSAANQFARLVLNKPWCRAGSPSDEVRYWCALIAAEALNDRRQSLRWLGAARSDERARTKSLRENLDAAEKAFPSRD